MIRRMWVGAWAVVFLIPMACAERVRVEPESVGVSSERLERLGRVMQQYVDDGRIAGVVTYIARAGEVVHLEAFGSADIAAARAMRTDTIFRIASQTKALTSVAAMMLVEEGRISLTDRVSIYIPAFAKTSVAVVPATGSAPAAAPAARAITIRDLMTHTAGIAYGMGPAQAFWKAAGIQNWYFADRNEPMAKIVERMAALPMDAQPGEKFVYGYSADILGVVVEKASGVTLDEFFRERITGPLRLADTYFYLPPRKRERFAAMYSIVDGKLAPATDPQLGDGHYVDGPRVAFSGGAGLVSTAADYGRFLQMLLNGGELDGVRLLSPKTVQLMTVNHVGRRFSESRFTDGDTGFGLGFEVIDDLGASGRLGSEGAYGWGGAYHTVYWVDPAEQLVAMLLTQLRPNGDSSLHAKFRALVYQSVIAPPPSRSPRSAVRAAARAGRP